VNSYHHVVYSESRSPVIPAILVQLKCKEVLFWKILIFDLMFRSEQDKEPEQEVVAEVTGTGPSEETVSDGM